MVGFFANTVVIRADLAGQPTFRALLHRCDETVVDATANQDVPFGTLVEALKPERVPGRNPLFQHLFTLLPASMVPLFRFADLQVATLMPQPGTSRFDFSFQISDESDGGLGVWIEYSTELYDRERIERLVEHLTTVLSAAVATPDAIADSLDLLSAAEADQVLTGWNPVASPRDGRLLHEVFADRAAQAPDRVAMRFLGTDLAYGELDAGPTSWRICWWTASMSRRAGWWASCWTADSICPSPNWARSRPAVPGWRWTRSIPSSDWPTSCGTPPSPSW